MPDVSCTETIAVFENVEVMKESMHLLVLSSDSYTIAAKASIYQPKTTR